jgi:phosphoglycerate-specific signal transduction histidine kinase
MTTTSRTITTATAELDRALDALRIAVERAEAAIGQDVSDLASQAIDDLVDLMPRVTLVDRLVRNLDELAVTRGEV